MAIKLTCACGQRMAVEKQNIGRKVACPGCGKHLMLDRAKLIAFARRSANGSRSSSLAASTPSSAARHPMPAELDVDVFKSDGDDLLGLLDDDAINAQLAALPNSTRPSIGPGGTHLDRDLADSSPFGERPICPSCGNTLPPRSKLCVQCGIDVKTGRSMVTSTDGHLETAYLTADKIIWWVSWLPPWFGVYPIASEAYGGRKPYFVRVIALLTILVSMYIWHAEGAKAREMRSYKQLMLWSGNKPPDVQTIENLYALTNWGDSEAFEARLSEAVAAKHRAAKEAELASRKSRGSDAKEVKLGAALGTAKNSANETDAETSNEEADASETSGETADTDSESSEDEDEDEETSDEEWELRQALAPEVHASLPLEARVVGEYRHYQLLTNAFLHADLIHLFGNLLFLFVLGSRVNALIGNAWSAVIYPVLAIFGSLGHAISVADQPTQPALGASGAIMGLAGMYLVLFPVHKVHMAAWLRILIWRPFKLWPVRGFWVVLFYIAFDIVSTVLGVDDGVAHWAHLGGFIGGVALALILIVTRRINARGADLVSALLGKRAWAIVGKPRA